MGADWTFTYENLSKTVCEKAPTFINYVTSKSKFRGIQCLLISNITLD